MTCNPIIVLKTKLNNCRNLHRFHRKRYSFLKKIDDCIDFFNAVSSGASIILIVIGFSNPICLMASAIISGINFIVERGQDKLNFKSRYNQHHTTYHQFADLVREIQIVLSKNNLSKEEYLDFIEEVNSKISLIEDSQLI